MKYNGTPVMSPTWLDTWYIFLTGSMIISEIRTKRFFNSIMLDTWHMARCRTMQQVTKKKNNASTSSVFVALYLCLTLALMYYKRWYMSTSLIPFCNWTFLQHHDFLIFSDSNYTYPEYTHLPLISINKNWFLFTVLVSFKLDA